MYEDFGWLHELVVLFGEDFYGFLMIYVSLVWDMGLRLEWLDPVFWVSV
jgi:hypothetical protein